jgi:hypothetical protein
MGTLMDNNSADTVGLLERARAGDKAALNELFVRHRPRLRLMVELRLDRRLHEPPVTQPVCCSWVIGGEAADTLDASMWDLQSLALSRQAAMRSTPDQSPRQTLISSAVGSAGANSLRLELCNSTGRIRLC